MAGYQEELLYTSTEDGLLLEGVLMRPRDAAPRPLSFVVIHGNAARFYDYEYVSLCRGLAEVGYACISGNTRGHDIAAFLWRGADGRPVPWRGPQDFPVGGGSGWENLADASRDVAAWVAMAAGLAAAGVILVGHSSGAQRVLPYQAEHGDPRVRGLVLASPDLHGFTAPGELETAQRMVTEGRGMEVLSAQPFAPFYRQSASSLVARAAVVSALHESGLAALRVPVLAFFGEREPGVDAAFDTLRREATGVSGLETRVIPGGDHVYSAVEGDVVRVIAEWVEQLANP